MTVELRHKQRSFRFRVILCMAVAVPGMVLVLVALLNGFPGLALVIAAAGTISSYLYERDFRCSSCGSRLQESQRAWLRWVVISNYVQLFGPRPDPSVPCHQCGATVHATSSEG